MQGFLIRLRKITSDDAYTLYLYARTRCSDYAVVVEPTTLTILFSGVLLESVCWKKFRRNMRSNLSNWNIEHVTNKLWIQQLTTFDEYMRISGGFSDLKSKALSDAVVQTLVTSEVAAIMKVKSLQICEQLVKHNDKFIKRAVFNAFAAIVKENDHKRQRLEM
jgi:hypothetical protein